METKPIRESFQNILRWFVPIAAALAFAAWMYLSPEGALGKLDAIGYAVCHRIDARSFHIDDRQLPLCARCTGEFYAAGVALIFQVFVSGKRSKLPSRGIIAVLVLFFSIVATTTISISTIASMCAQCVPVSNWHFGCAVMLWSVCAKRVIDRRPK